MPDPISALVAGGSGIVSGLVGGHASSRAAKAQAGAAEAGIDEQRRQFEAMQELLKPYTEAGLPALQQQQALLGLRGTADEQAALAGLEASPTFQALARQGETSLLQSASATGGLRGGNIQAALAEFRPQLLAQMIEDRYGKLAGLTQLGQQSAAGVGGAGIQTGANVANLLGQAGAARAGGILGRAQAIQGVLNMPSQFLGMQYGAGVQKPGFAGLL